MRPDREIKADLDSALRSDPEIDEKDIATKVNDGVVTLTGFVGTFYEKFKAEATVKGMSGVTAVANDIEVRFSRGEDASDPEIARHAVETLKRVLPAGWEAVKPLVHHGHVTLEGSVAWHHQRENAINAVARLHGVTGISNGIRVAPDAVPDTIQHTIDPLLM